MKRREFLKVLGATTGACALSQTSIFSAGYTNAQAPAETVAGMPRRLLGRTGARVSIVGFPGLALVQEEYDQDRCTKALHDAFAKGVNYYDVAPAYGKGKCETRMGIGLQGLDRSKYFLACKTKMRDKDGARQELETSLKLLKTDHFDLYQMHHIRSVDEVKTALGKGGAVETFLKAKEEGLIKHIGFSAHTTKGALEIMKGFRFETAMFPINFVELYNRGFGKDVLDLANEQGVAVLAIKPMLYGRWPDLAKRTRKWWYRSVEEPHDVDLAWRFTLSRKGVVAGIPVSYLDLTEKAIEAARNYRPATEAELAELKQMAASCTSLFEEEEKKFAHAGPQHPHDDGSEYYS
jgi:aryl-alcohol dehydrogenase-like predicted oxidoreductase